MPDMVEARVAGGGALNAEHHAEEHPTHRQTRSAQNQREGQKISVCEMPETKPQAREASGTVVLPEVFGCDG
jgi:hypothetical protein